MTSTNNRVFDIIRNKRTQLPTLPVVAGNILKITSDDSTSARDLADFIINDQAIVNKLLRLANSAYYGLIKKVDNISRAITVIGFSDVTSLAIGMSVFSSFDLKGVDKVVSMHDLWLHSICCATAAKSIATKINLPVDEQIFLCGLLHDMGKIIFAIHFPEEYKEVLDQARIQQKPLFMVEHEILGIEHATIAGYLMEQWNFPDKLLVPCKYHHNPFKCPDEHKKQAMLLEVADFVCLKSGIGLSGTPELKDVKITAKNLGLQIDDLKKIAMDLNRQRSKMEEFLKFLD
ncbi:MAG: HDOD domain-containing protein [Proteobacteria bacterium]|nr:HDOD domain-containing protein [Pseudomonadota bacterium]MBU1709129.1 HDOD domain-containing protein [Pseudomonadota bacterium]